jgi:putative proteasome-type protease
MTFCVGIRVREGLIVLADGRITAGSQVTSARKVSLHGAGPNQFLLMTSGLRSVRDKTVAYLERAMSANAPFETLFDAVQAFADRLREVADEDKAALKESGLDFNLHAIIGGRLAGDREPGLYMVYPEGNWIQVDERTPYLAIGQTTYGKPILDRALRPETSMATALKIAYLSFDSSRVSSADVGFPIDVMTLPSGHDAWRHAQFDDDDLARQRRWWNTHIKRLAERMPDGPWVTSLLP